MRGVTRYAIIAGVVLVVLIIGIIVAAIFQVLLDVLYIFLMLLAALVVVATLMQIYWIMMLIQTVTTVREEMKPLLTSVEETVDIVKDTAKSAGHTVSSVGSISNLTSEFVLGPGVRVTAGAMAALQVMRVFLGKGHVMSRAEQRRKQQMEAGAGAGGR